VVVLVGAPAALAAPTAAFTGTTLTITGDVATGDTIAVSQGAASVDVTSAGITLTAPANGCTLAGNVVSCPDATASTVIVNAGSGADTLSDTRTGNLGPDSDTLNGGGGADTLTAVGNAFDGTKRLNGDDGNDTLTKNSDNVFGFGGPGQVVLNGGLGDDTLNAGTGALSEADTGGAGNDVFNGSAQSGDNFVSEPGSDTYNGGSRVPTATDIVDDPGTFQRFSAGDSISYAAHTDGVAVSLDNAANDGAAGEGDNVVADVENVTGGQAADTLTAGAPSAGLFGAAGNDAISGGPADDFLDGGDGADSLAGGAGDDFIRDGDFTDGIQNPGDPAQPIAGNDALDGGAGNDTLVTDRGADNVVGGPGRDDAFFAQGFGNRAIPQASTVTTPIADAGFTISLDDLANDGVTGAGEGDNVHSDVENVTTDGRAADVISTGAGNDAIDGGAGADTINAGDGDDAVNAVDATTDIIDCGRGTDAANVDLAGAQALRADVTFDCETITGQAFGAVAPPVDTSKPVLKLSSKRVKVKAFRGRGLLPITVTCSKACSLAGEAFTSKARIITRVASVAGQFKVGAASLPLGAGTRTLKVKIARKYLLKYRRALRTKAQRKRGLSFRVSVTASDAIGIQAIAGVTVKVKG